MLQRVLGTIRAGRGRKPRLGILSGYYPGIRFASQVNHRIYAERYGCHYIFAGSPGRDPRGFFLKLENILRYLDLFEWIFWIDDDAYFTDFEKPLESFLEQAQDHELLICKSPSTKKVFTKFSSGQFFIRSTRRAREFLHACLNTELEEVRRWWREDLGLFSEGDQDAMVYRSESDPRFSKGFLKIVDHNQFNNRDFEYAKALNEHFLVHFTGHEKVRSKAEFCARLGCNKYLVPDSLLSKYRVIASDTAA